MFEEKNNDLKEEEKHDESNISMQASQSKEDEEMASEISITDE